MVKNPFLTHQNFMTHPAQLMHHFEETRNALKEANNILLISHRGPDGDTVGCALALFHALTQWGKAVTLACIDEIPQSLLFLQGSKKYHQDFTPSDFDCIAAIDCGSQYQMKFEQKYPEILSHPVLINIDHHPSNDYFGTLNIIDEEAAATAIIMYKFLNYCEFKITPAMATGLLTGLYFDTGSFMHSNTNSETLTIASELMAKGAQIHTIVKNLFRTTTVNQMRVWGRILERTKITPKNITVSMVTQKDFEEEDASPEGVKGVIDLLNSVPNTRFCILLNEDKNGLIKGSCRTQKNDINLSKVAQIFGGGGHKKAAGFAIKGSLDSFFS